MASAAVSCGLPQLTRPVIVIMVLAFVGFLLARGLDLPTIIAALTSTTVVTGQLIGYLSPHSSDGEV